MRLLHEEIDNYLSKNLYGFHSPAHGASLTADKEPLKSFYARDLSELPGLDDINFPETSIKNSQEFIAELFTAAQSFMLVGGASQGLQAAILSLAAYAARKNITKPILLARNVHRSVLAGVILAGLEIEWFEPEWNSELGLYTRFSLEPKKINSKYLAVVVTNPSYEGFSSVLAELEIPLVVDEAHGAHYHFSEQLPQPALKQNADLVVQSWHKCLGSLGQTGVLHVSRKSKIAADLVAEQLSLLQTTSPSYLLLDSISRTAAELSKTGIERFGEALELAASLQIPAYPNDDPLRLNICLPGFSGAEIDDFFEANSVILEKHSSGSALAFINYSHSAEHIKKLDEVYCKLKKQKPKHKNLQSKKMQKAPFLSEESPRKMFFSGAAKLNAPCPPGVLI